MKDIQGQTNLEIEESRRMRDRNIIRDRAEKEVRHEAEASAAVLTESEKEHVDTLASELKQKTVSEVRQTEREVTTGRAMARIGQVTDYVFYLIYGVIGLEILLELLGAREGNRFKEFIDSVSAPVLLPFHGLLSEPTAGVFAFRTSFIMALVVYLLLHLAVKGLLRMIAYRSTKL